MVVFKLAQYVPFVTELKDAQVGLEIYRSASANGGRFAAFTHDGAAECGMLWHKAGKSLEQDLSDISYIQALLLHRVLAGHYY